ncbi:complement C4-like [Sinocyclocheilus rhinocerous]|uniref:complement C4-like n=1 Tax=Sinocyclocheilus rhinocerous TaxID=307959 RepID=UPI0007B8C360|nr:PREDICTED: complement C4-like [Sinocyclocheilus rhinocerous]
MCTCAEGGCPKLTVTFSKDMKHNTRSSYACYSPAVDYGVLDSDATRQMILRLSCDEMELKNEAHYLIMGQEDAISVLNNDGQHFGYVLNNDMWIEKIPEEKKCKATISRSACHLLNEFLKQHPINTPL